MGTPRLVGMIDDTEKQRRYDLVTDTMASWALEGLEPNDFIVDLAREYVAGRIDENEVEARVEAHSAALR